MRVSRSTILLSPRLKGVPKYLLGERRRREEEEEYTIGEIVSTNICCRDIYKKERLTRKKVAFVCLFVSNYT